jgi:hypothetical protein
VSVSDALPVPDEPNLLSKAEVTPTPLCLHSEKPAGAEGPVPWWARPRTEVQRRDSADPAAAARRLKRPEDDLFVYRAGPAVSWTAFRPQLRIRLRNGRSNPGQDNPDLFAIEQIAEQTLFLCEIRGKSTAELGALSRALAPVLEKRRWLRIGRGGAPVEVARAAWSNPPAIGGRPMTDGLLTLTSDLLARDDCLRWLANLDEQEFRAIAGSPPDLHVTPIEQESVAVHGFNGTSRLWRMPATAIRRGSVFKVTGQGVATLAARVAQGKWLGERTHEGFGRFRLDATLPGVTPGGPVSVGEPSPGDSLEETIAKATHDWFEAHRALASGGSSEDPPPSLSQWRDLVAELAKELADTPARGNSAAIASRLAPETAGKQTWRHHDAVAILNKLKAISDSKSRASYARMFVRWLSAAMRVGRQ